MATRHDLSVEETAALYVETIRRVVPEGPFFLGGYSYGCVVTFEMAQQLRRAGHEVALVALLDGQFLGSRIFRGEQVGLRQNRPRILWQRIKAAVSYRPRAYPGRIVYLHAEGHSAWKNWRNLRKWRRLSGEPIEIVEVEGDHLGILQEPYVVRVAEVLRGVIDRNMEEK